MGAHKAGKAVYRIKGSSHPALSTTPWVPKPPAPGLYWAGVPRQECQNIVVGKPKL